jgi:sterol desaturase/sphingolipid hydroxylase (fatty acid hydroxylase superfamily)
MAHHFANPAFNFGISHMWMDALLGSLNTRGTEGSAEGAESSKHGPETEKADRKNPESRPQLHPPS